MKVRVWIEANGEVNISLDDVLAELDRLPDSERKGAIFSAINTAYGMLLRVSVECIAEMSDAQRDVICNALREQSDRYLMPTAVTPASIGAHGEPDTSTPDLSPSK